TRGDLVREVAVDGSVVAAFRPTLTSPARGVVRGQVQAGDAGGGGHAVVRVGRDEVLVRVESPEVDSRLAQERSALLSAQSDLQRQRILARQDRLQREQGIALLGVPLEAAKRAMGRGADT